MKRELEAKMNAAESRHNATIEAKKTEAAEEVTKAKTVAEAKKSAPAGEEKAE